MGYKQDLEKKFDEFCKDDDRVNGQIVYAFASLHEVCENLIDFMGDMIDSKDKRVIVAKYHLEEMKKYVNKINEERIDGYKRTRS